MTRVKICGLTNLADACAAADAGADFLGFVFAPGPRRLDPQVAARFWGGLPPAVPKVAVFCDQTLDEVERTLSLVRPDYLQFHGAETPGFCRVFGMPVIRAIPASAPVLLAVAEVYADFTRYYLVDLPKEEAEDDSLPAAVAQAARHLPRPVFLAGGLTPANVRSYVERFQPFGVDVARGVESAPGVKSRAKVQAFVRAAKTARNPG